MRRIEIGSKVRVKGYEYHIFLVLDQDGDYLDLLCVDHAFDEDEIDEEYTVNVNTVTEVLSSPISSNSTGVVPVAFPPKVEFKPAQTTSGFTATQLLVLGLI